MTRHKETTRVGDTHLVGIRFKPAAFTHFYRYASLHELTDTAVEFERPLTPLIRPSMTRHSGCPDRVLDQTDQKPVFTGHLDHWFMDRLSAPRDPLFPIIDEINQRRGQIAVPELAQKHYISIRRLERLFKQHIGLSPKEFINFVRYQFAIHNVREQHTSKSLLQIAFDSGYYDHSHLANEIKKYSGLVPSQL
jgi:AraC-like DNA-binding protein